MQPITALVAKFHRPGPLTPTRKAYIASALKNTAYGLPKKTLFFKDKSELTPAEKEEFLNQMLMMTAAEMYEFIDALLTAHGTAIPLGFTFQINGEQRVVLYYAENDEKPSKEPLRKRSYS